MTSTQPISPKPKILEEKPEEPTVITGTHLAIAAASLAALALLSVYATRFLIDWQFTRNCAYTNSTNSVPDHVFKRILNHDNFTCTVRFREALWGLWDARTTWCCK